MVDHDECPLDAVVSAFVLPGLCWFPFFSFVELCCCFFGGGVSLYQSVSHRRLMDAPVEIHRSLGLHGGRQAPAASEKPAPAEPTKASEAKAGSLCVCVRV